MKKVTEALEAIFNPDNWWHTSEEPGGPFTAWRGEGEPDEIAESALTSLKSGELVIVDGEILQGILHTLDHIVKADKTPKYKEGEPCADGRKCTVKGQMFLTPRQLALQELAYLDAYGIQWEVDNES